MALLLTINDPRGFDVQDAYCKVEGVVIEDKVSMRFQLRCYKEAGFTVAFSDVSFTCAYSLDSGNPYEQAYNHLKSLPEFSTAADA